MSERAPCPFCAAAEGASRTPVVYETEKVLALFPLHPATRGHTLVVPRDHMPDISALDPAAVPPLIETLLFVAKTIRQALNPEGLNVITSAGAAATQTVRHLHIHLVPRWHDDGFGKIWPEPGPSFAEREIREMAETIRIRLCWRTNSIISV
ncbi:HIT family protein [Micromonospora sp. NPDC049836]|uniref:HIT family protein n=1 Tax=Micromonospora sp. NPDC049836 TaxID=3364274 RepID=UPI0037B187D3